MRSRMFAKASPPRAITFRIIEWLTCMDEVSGSGSAARSRSNEFSLHDTNPSGGFLRTTFLSFFGIIARLRDRAGVLGLVLWRLRDDRAFGVVPRAPCATGDLVELACGELPHLRAVELGEPGQQHGADRHVDADAERVGACDHPQQPALGELLDQPPVLGQHPRVVHADARIAPASRASDRSPSRTGSRRSRRRSHPAAPWRRRGCSSSPGHARARPPARSARCRSVSGAPRAGVRRSRAPV